MKKVTLQRFSDDGKQTLGELSVEGLFTCKTLELPFKDNQHNISCIPCGSYPCKWTRSNRLSISLGRDVFTYEVLNVPDRSGIRIHSANFAHELLGCIALGGGYVDLDGDGEQDLVNSRISVKQFNELLNEADFDLTITNNFDA